MYRSVLLALDRDDEAGCDLLAERCAGWWSGEGTALHLVHVRPQLPRSYLRELPANWEQDDRAAAEGWLRAFAEGHGLSARVAGVHSPAGAVAQEVTRLAASLEVEAICVAAHRMDLGRYLLGTSTQAIVRDAPCDVIVVRERAGQPRPA